MDGGKGCFLYSLFFVENKFLIFRGYKGKNNWDGFRGDGKAGVLEFGRLVVFLAKK